MVNLVATQYTQGPLICVTHRCGHTLYYEAHALTSARSRAEITASESKRRCLACVLASEKKR